MRKGRGKTKKIVHEWSPHKYLVADARKRWRYSPARTAALNRSKVEPAHWQCTQCKEIVTNIKYVTKRGKKASKVDGAVDHIVPVGKQPRSWEEYPAYYRRMFCDSSNLAFLCTRCHDKKTEIEREARKIKRQELKGWKWPFQRVSEMSGKKEYACPHGVGHSSGIHGCEGCCSDKNFPGRGQ